MFGATLFSQFTSATRCEYIQNFIRVISQSEPEFISLPKDASIQELIEKSEFSTAWGSVGTLLTQIDYPDLDRTFDCMFGFQAIKTVLVVDSNSLIRYVSTGFPGSMYDFAAFKSTTLCKQFNAMVVSGSLLAGPGFVHDVNLITPYRRPSCENEVLFNQILATEFQNLNMTLQRLTELFPLCVLSEYDPEITGSAIMCMCILHNIFVSEGY